MENFVIELQTIFINFWFGSLDNYNNFISQNISNGADGKWNFFSQWIADFPNIGVVFCSLFLLGFAWLLFYFFWCLIRVVKYQDRSDEYGERWKKK